ncbi:DedA family protein [Cellulomonas sp. SG140]|uniref:DedA family protein n=1 Tax=Cellulomonas sp. SG140 TaxID=2976536 RepID=UPI0021E94B35|nr:DedA family protein [Cellulomonas sp. SG140]
MISSLVAGLSGGVSTGLTTGLSISPEPLLHALGPWALVGIAVMIFVESGVLFPFLPGDSLILTAVLLRAQLGLSPWAIAGVALAAAVAGDQTGYWLGHRFGRRFFRDDARVLTTARLAEAERFFDRYGPVSLVLARFVPIVRTYVPLVAGTARLRYRRFVVWNVTGALLWVVGLTLVALLLGGIPFVAKNIDLLAIVVVVVSVLPLVVTGLRRRGQNQDRELVDADRDA